MTPAAAAGGPPEGPPPAVRLGLALAGLIAVAAGTVVAYSLGQGAGAVIFLVVVTALTALGYRMAVTPPTDPGTGGPDPDAPVPGRPFPRFVEWHTHLAEGRRDLRYYDRVLRPRLHELAIDRARDRYGPQAGDSLVRSRLGERAWSLVDPAIRTDQRVPGPAEADLAHLIEQLERL